MSQDRLILRDTQSPFTGQYADITQGSVLSWAQMDGNFIYLKGETIYSATTVNGSVTLKKLNGNDISFPLDISLSGLSEIYYPLTGNPAGYLTQDEVLSFSASTEFPVVGEAETIYIAEDTGLGYTWNGSTYTLISTTGIAGLGTPNFIPKFLSANTITNSRFFDGGASGGRYGELGGSNIQFVSGSNRFLKINRAQSNMEFILGNPGFSQPNIIYSNNNLDGTQIMANGNISLFAGSTLEGFTREGFRVLSGGTVMINQTPLTGTTSDSLLVRDISGNVKSLSVSAITNSYLLLDGSNANTNINIGANSLEMVDGNDLSYISPSLFEIYTDDGIYSTSLYQGGIDGFEIVGLNKKRFRLQAALGLGIGTNGNTPNSHYAWIKSDNITAEETFQLPNKSGSGGTFAMVEYLVYTALLSQSGTDAPTAIVLENTLGFTPTFSRSNAGLYNINATEFSTIDVDKLLIFTGTGNVGGNINLNVFTVFSGGATIDLQVASGGANVDILNNTPIEIRIYP